MAKKNWIYIKRGLSEDPKHRAAMGECVWLYMHIIDRADWETGIAFGWKDKEEAADMSMPVDTMRRQRQKLEELDYIRTKQKQHSQDIYIMEWKNPRDYGADTKNPRFEGGHGSLPSDVQGLNQGLNQGSNEGDNQGSNQVQVPMPTPSYSSKSKSVSKSLGASAKPKANTFPALVLFRQVTKRYPHEVNWQDVIDSISKVNARLGKEADCNDLIPFYKFWTSKGYNPYGLGWMDWAVTGTYPKNGKDANIQEPKAFDGIRKFLARHQGESNG